MAEGGRYGRFVIGLTWWLARRILVVYGEVCLLVGLYNTEPEAMIVVKDDVVLITRDRHIPKAQVGRPSSRTPIVSSKINHLATSTTSGG
jgi:hypothetical protein